MLCGKGPGVGPPPDQRERPGMRSGTRPAVAEAGSTSLPKFSVIVARWADGRHAVWIRRRMSIATASAHFTIPCGPTVAHTGTGARAAARASRSARPCRRLTVEFFASADGPMVNGNRAPRVITAATGPSKARSPRNSSRSARSVVSSRMTGSRPRGGHGKYLIGNDLIRGPNSSPKSAQLHIYGKREARPGRKMGHVVWVLQFK